MAIVNYVNTLVLVFKRREETVWTHTQRKLVKPEGYSEVFDLADISLTVILVPACACLSSEQIIFTIIDHILRHKVIKLKVWNLSTLKSN